MRTNDPATLRRLLVDAAYAAFTTQGYHATSVHAVRAATGVSGGALAHHFPTKRELALAVLNERVAPAVEDAWMAPVALAASAAEGVQAAFAAVARQLDAQGQVHGCPLNNLALEIAQADPAFGAVIAGVFAGWRTLVADKLRDDQRAGRVARTVDADALATLVVSAYSGAMALAKAQQDAEPLRACARQLTQLDGLAWP